MTKQIHEMTLGQQPPYRFFDELMKANQIGPRHRNIVFITEAGEQRECLQHLFLVVMGSPIHRNIDVVIAHAEANDRALDTVARRDAGEDHSPFAALQFSFA